MFQSYFTFYIQLVLIQKNVALPFISVLDLQYLRVDSLTHSFLKLCTYQFLFSHRTVVKFTLILSKTRFHFRWIPFIFLPFSQDYYLLVHRLRGGPGRHGGQRHRRHHWHQRGRKAWQHDFSRVGLRQKLFPFFFFFVFSPFSATAFCSSARLRSRPARCPWWASSSSRWAPVASNPVWLPLAGISLMKIRLDHFLAVWLPLCLTCIKKNTLLTELSTVVAHCGFAVCKLCKNQRVLNWKDYFIQYVHVVNLTYVWVTAHWIWTPLVHTWNVTSSCSVWINQK